MPDDMSQQAGRTVAITAAVHAEVAPLIRRLALRPGMGCHVGTYGNDTILLYTTGVGEGYLAETLSDMLASGRPDVVLSIGFAGALDEALVVGDVLHVRQVLHASGGAVDLRGVVPVARSVDQALDAATLLTCDEVAESAEVKRRLRAAHPAVAVDMETFHIAQLCVSEKIGMACMRAISDGADEALPGLMAHWTNARGRARPIAITFDLLTHPWLVPTVARVGRQSRLAAARLAEAVAAWLARPAD